MRLAEKAVQTPAKYTQDIGSFGCDQTRHTPEITKSDVNAIIAIFFMFHF